MSDHPDLDDSTARARRAADSLRRLQRDIGDELREFVAKIDRSRRENPVPAGR